MSRPFFSVFPPVRVGLCFSALALGALAHGQEKPAFSPAQIEFFEREVRPLLVENCQDCHGAKSANLGLRLDSRAAVLKGSDYRPVVDLSAPEKSVLLLAVRHAGGKVNGQDVPAMPKKQPKLKDSEIATLERWLREGAPWPDEVAPAKTDPRAHWAFQPLQPVSLPAGAGHPVDRFLNASLSKAGLKPAPAADEATLYKRLSIDLLGLPPTYEGMQAYLGEASAEAWPRLVDAMLASPAYGERSARHWMDLARYSDTRGYEANARERRFIFSHTYRDWLIDSFNRDLPYDQFLLYQIAADQLVDWNGPEKTHLAALGFLTLSKNGSQEEIFDDRIDTIFRGTMGLTVACARCHDHKFDPISTKEYYGLYGVLLNSIEPERPDLPVIGCDPEGPEFEAYKKELANKQKTVDEFIQPKFQKIAQEFPKIAQDRNAMMNKLSREDRKKFSDLEKVVDKFVADSAMEADRALVIKDREKMINQRVFIRGTSSRQGDIAPRGFLSIASAGRPTEFSQGSGRLEMARAITARDNPLTARVIVNRVWMQHFGEGLVRSVSDFGIQGEPPTHPELLDWLAGWFIEHGWSLKELHRLMVTSEAYRRGSIHPQADLCRVKDPENRLLWEMPRRRVDFETLRDSLLTASGLLDPRIGGRSEDLFKAPYSRRRTLYAYIDRQNLDPVFRHFDFANPQEHTGKRPRTTIPMQALFSLNSDFFKTQASSLLQRPEVAAATSPEDKVRALTRAVFARDPDTDETQMALDFLAAYQKTANHRENQQTLSAWQFGFGGWNAQEQKPVFHPMKHWTGKAWQVEARYPVPKDPHSYLTWTQTGASHPGEDEVHAAVLRWVAPANMKIRLSGTLLRPNQGKGDGVRWRLIVDGKLVREETMPPAEKARALTQDITVLQGQTVDTAIDDLGHTAFDSVTWAPTIQEIDGAQAAWSYATDFSGPQTVLDPWQAYAQALFCTNETVFVD